MAHAEAVKQVTHLRQELQELQAKARDYQSAAETASARATNSEASWNSQRDAMSKEMEDVLSRCKDLTAQNAALHQHLETVSSQAARIRQAAEASGVDGSSAKPNGVDESDSDATAELREVIKYLRREKEIVDLQDQRDIAYLSSATSARSCASSEAPVAGVPVAPSVPGRRS